MKTPLEILKIKAPDGTEKFKALISLQDAISDSTQSKKLIQVQDEYTKYVTCSRELWLKVESNRKNMANSRSQWELADFFFSFVNYAEKEGYVVTNIAEAITRDVGISNSQLNYLRKFRTRYPSVENISDQINWSKYREIMDIKSPALRKMCEEKILAGEIKTDYDIRQFKKNQRLGPRNKKNIINS